MLLREQHCHEMRMVAVVYRQAGQPVSAVSGIEDRRLEGETRRRTVLSLWEVRGLPFLCAHPPIRSGHTWARTSGLRPCLRRPRHKGKRVLGRLLGLDVADDRQECGNSSRRTLHSD